MKKLWYVLVSSLLLFQWIEPYGLRAVNLGLTNFLDGGPLRPRSGWYWVNYNQYYYTSKFLDAQGKPLGSVESPRYNLLSNINQLQYESARRVLGARLGFSGSIAIVLLSHIQKNVLDISSSGAGWTDLRLDLFLQWDPVMFRGRAVYVNNIDFGVFFPTGKNEQPCHDINPGGNVYAIDPYWAATVYLREDWTIAWRLHYLWATENPATHVQAGDAVHINYSTEYRFTQHFHAGINGYYLQQLHDNKLQGQKVPDSRERVVGIGPGIIYFVPDRNLIILGHTYGEFHVLNRTQGFSAVLQIIKYF